MNPLSPLLLLLTLTTMKCDGFKYRLIKDYLQWKNLRVILFVTCGGEYVTEVNKLIKNLQSTGIWTDHWDTSMERNLSNFDYERYFVRLGYQYCVTVHLHCMQTQNLLSEISQRQMFHFERNWLIFGNSAKQTFNVLSQENINVDAEVATVVPIDDKEYRIDDVYNPSHLRHGQFRIEEVGTWSERMGLNVNEIVTKFERRRNFGGVTFLSVITLLMEMFNFKMSIRRAKIWGSKTSDGNWLGAIGLINRSEIDICISGLRWENERYEVFDQTTHSYYSQILFIFRHPKTVDAANVFIAPFSMAVWSLILTVVAVTSLVIKNICLMENRNRTNIIRKLKENNKTDSSYINSFLMVFGILFQQGFTGKPSLVSSRVLFTTMLMFSLCIYQFYGSYIVGSLLTDGPKTIKTIQHLLNSKLEIAVDEVPYILDNFQHAREESTVKLYNKVMSQSKPLIPLYEGLNRVKKGSFAYHTDGSYAYTILKSMLTDSEAHDLQDVKYLSKIVSGPGLPKKSPLREMVKIGIRKLFETGILAYHWKIWIGHLPKSDPKDVNVVPVDVIHFSSALYMLGFGIQISIFILIGEIVAIHL